MNCPHAPCPLNEAFSEKHLLQGCSTPSPYISLLPPVSSHKLPNPVPSWHDSLRELGSRVCKGVVSPKKASQWYTIVTASLEEAPAQDAFWDVVSNEHPRESDLANPKLPRCWGTRPGKVALLKGCETCKRAAELSSTQWPTMHNLHSAAWSAPTVGAVEETSGTREDTRKQTSHTDVDRLRSTLPRRGDLPTHVNMMLILSDKYHVDMHVGSHFGEHDGLVGRTNVCDGGDMLLFASTIRQRGVPALPGVEKHVVPFHFLTTHERHR